MENFNLNMIPSGVSPVCHVSQYDNGRQIKINLFSGTLPYELASGDTVTLNLRKPDNTIITASVTATQGNDYVIITTTEQMTAVVGETLGELKITNGSTTIGSLNFVMLVERDVLADGVDSESEIQDLQAKVNSAVNNSQKVTDIEHDLSLITEKSNLFHIDNYTQYGVTLTNLSNGAFKLNGTQVGTYDIPVVTLPAGKYTAYFERISGSITSASNVSLRINNSRWVNEGNTVVTVDLTEPATAYFRINNGTVLTDYVCKVVINSGETVNPAAYWQLSAIDYVLRNQTHKVKIAFVGDSLTQGLTGGTSGAWTFASKPYPTIFKEFIKNNKFDISVLNFGRRGLSAKSYWNNAIPVTGTWHSPAAGEPGDTISFDSSIDAVIIMLGTNGNLNNNTIAEDTAITEGQTYLDYADTQCGDYCKIIEYIMENTQNHAQIILVAPIYSTDPDHEQKMINTLPTIKALGERYQIPVINALYESGLGKFNVNAFYNTSDLVHLNQAGYHKLGSFIASQFVSLFSTFNMDELT